MSYKKRRPIRSCKYDCPMEAYKELSVVFGISEKTAVKQVKQVKQFLDKAREKNNR